MASGDATRIPIRGAEWRHYSAIYKTTGVLVTGLTSPSSMIAKDGALAAPGPTPVEIASAFGGIYTDYSAANMTADLLAVRYFCTNADASHTVRFIPIYRLALGGTGTAQAGAAGSITLAAGSPASDDVLNGVWIRTTGGAGAFQARQVYDYSGVNKVATVMPDWTTTPNNTTTYEWGTPVSAFATGNLATVQDHVSAHYNALRSTYNLAGSFGEGQRIADGELVFKRNQAFTNFLLDMTLSSDHLTEATGKVVTTQRSIDGGAWAPTTNQPSADIGFGTYPLNLSAADLNGAFIKLRATATGCDPRRWSLVTQP